MHHQIMHVRHMTPATEIDGPKLQAKGGITFAFRCIEDHDGCHIEYAFAECSVEDHYNKMKGRSIAASRLDSSSPIHFNRFTLETPLRGEDKYLIENHEEDLGYNVIDVMVSAVNVRQLILEHHLQAMYELTMEEIGIVIGNRFYLNEEVLIPELPTVEEIANELAEVLDSSEISTLSQTVQEQLSSVFARLCLISGE